MTGVRTFGPPRFATTLADLRGGQLEHVRVGQTAPTIVLETGMSHDLSTWNPIIDSVAGLGTLFAYNRSGYGRSSYLCEDRSLASMALALREVLEAGAAEAPFVLVGHSYGACIVQAFAARFPAETAGLVCIDAATPRMRDLVMTSPDGEAYRRSTDALTGVVRQEWEAIMAPAGERTPWADHDRYGGPTVLLTATANSLGWPELEALRLTLADEAAADYPQAERRRVACAHNIHHERPLAVLDAIEEVLERSKRGLQ